MKLKSVVLLVVAVGCGLVAMLGVRQVLSGNKEEEKQSARVLMATAEILPGTPLDETNTVFKEMPIDLVPEGAVTDPDQIAEKTLKSVAVANEIIMTAKLTTEFGASNEIPKGMRVVTTSVNLTKTHSGLIRPGDRVDILLSYQTRDRERGMISKTKTILEFIEVFATDNVLAYEDAGDSAEIDAKNLSFLVTPEQAAILKLAESKGELHLALRHKYDEAHVDVSLIDETFFEEATGSERGLNDLADEGEQGPLMSELEGADTDGVREAIAAELAQTEPPQPETTAPVEIEPIEPEQPMWTVMVYAGEDVLEQQVPMPLDENGLTEEEAALAEREAKLAEWEARLQAREAQLQNQNGSTLEPDGSGSDSDLPDADASPVTAPTPTLAPDPTASPETEQTTPASPENAEDRPDAKLWKGVLKRFLTGA